MVQVQVRQWSFPTAHRVELIAGSISLPPGDPKIDSSWEQEKSDLVLTSGSCSVSIPAMRRNALGIAEDSYRAITERRERG